MSDTDDVNKAVEGWLASTGYTLEMRVARALLRHGLGIRQGWHYEDPETGKFREVDLLATGSLLMDRAVQLQAVIEIKYARRPFVVFSYGAQLSRRISDTGWQPTNELGGRLVQSLRETRLLHRMPLYLPLSPISYSLTEAKISTSGKADRRAGNGIDKGFDALSKVAKATHSLCTLYDEKITWTRTEATGETRAPIVYLAYPTIVIEGDLFSCHLAEDGDSPVVRRVKSALVEWTYPPVGTMNIRVVTTDDLDHFASQLVGSVRMLERDGKGQVNDLPLPSRGIKNVKRSGS